MTEEMEQELRVRLGNALKVARGPLNQTELANLTGIARQTIAGVEAGKQFPTVLQLLQLRLALGLDLNGIVEVNENQPKKKKEMQMITTHDLGKFLWHCDELLNKGWLTHGDFKVISVSNSFHYWQAFIKEN